MTKVRVESFTISIDGFGAGPNQSLENPLGTGTTDLFAWAFATRTFQAKVFGAQAGETGSDDEIAARGFHNVGAWIMGRNMFGPIRGPWPDESWKGWWGDNPVYHTPVFVLTNHPRAPLVMEGGTTFHFVTKGVRAALDLAREAAGGKDVRVGGGASTIRQFLRERLIDELHFAVSPVLLGEGEPLLAGINLKELGYKCTQLGASKRAAHVVLTRGGA